MEDFNFTEVDIQQNSKNPDVPFASIGQNRVALNPAACKLIDQIYEYPYVNILEAQDSKKNIVIALRFVKLKDTKSIRVTRRKYKGECVEGININSKALIQNFFGHTLDNLTKRFNVEKYNEVTLIINLGNEM